MEENKPVRRFNLQFLIFDLLLIIIILVGAYFRSVGLDWDESQHLHPDERFLTMVESALSPIGTAQEQLGPPPSVATQAWRQAYQDKLKDCEEWGGYFDTACSPLNPHNRGFQFYVYGTLPIFAVRYVAEWMGQAGYDQVHLVGRQLSALADLLTLVLIYLIAARVYNRKVGLLAALFSALAVLQIQLSHFFTVETYTNLFIYLAIYFAARIATANHLPLLDAPMDAKSRVGALVRLTLKDHLFWDTIGFGLVFGMALASKINAFPLAFLLPAAFLVLYFKVSGLGEPSKPDEGDPDRPVERAIPDPFWAVMLLLVIGGVMAFLSFRVAQPYAFRGEFGFLDIRINPAWLQNIRDQRAQASGNVDFPPALQWASRPVTFSTQNMVLWGLGIPVGLLAFAGLAWMGWRMFRGEWKTHALLWGWTIFYFLWQSIQWNPTMRYQMPIYPLMALMAAWFLVELAGVRIRRKKSERTISLKPLAIGLGVVAAVFSLAWSFAFIQVYTRPHSRVAATRWIYQNVPGPLNIPIQQKDGTVFQQPLPVYTQGGILSNTPNDTAFIPKVSGAIQEIIFGHVFGQTGGQGTDLLLNIKNSSDAMPLASTTFRTVPPSQESSSLSVTLDQPVQVFVGTNYLLEVMTLEPNGQADLCGTVRLHTQTLDGQFTDILVEPPEACSVTAGQSYQAIFTPEIDGTLFAVTFDRATSPTTPPSGKQSINATLTTDPNDESKTLAQGVLTADFSDASRNFEQVLNFDKPVELVKDQTYFLRLETDGSPLVLLGAAPINETSWDDGLPLRMDGYDGYGGLYQGSLNNEMYWDDTPEKFDLLTGNLDKGDYVFISSNRQWGTTTRVPLRYPLTIKYYRELIGCPPEKDVIWCYNVAKPGDFKGNLGYELVQVFESYPTLGGLSVNDQFAEEAFTVYDHPKVLIFKKTADYDPENVRKILGAVDLSTVIHVTPRDAGKYPSGPMLPRVCGALPQVCQFFGADELVPQTQQVYSQTETFGLAGLLSMERFDADQLGGTWSKMFDYEALQNANPVAGVLLWWLAFFILGIFTYPILRWTLPGLADQGYPLARFTGLLIWAYLAWIASSFGVPFTRVTVALAYMLIVLVGATLAFIQRKELKDEFRKKGKYFLLIEVLLLGFFLIDLFIRLGNPDLWHPYKGGERPMNFSQLNAILRTTTFPPYDPWFAGGYINYYYYGYVLVAMPIKLLAMVPSIAFNITLPTLYSLVAMAGFSIVWNLISGVKEQVEGRIESAALSFKKILTGLPFLGGLSASVGLILIGNLGIPRTIYIMLARLGAPAGDLTSSTMFERFGWAVSGLGKAFTGTPLPMYTGDWYWLPSRVIPAVGGEIEPITEFPLFSFLYSDLHAHMIVLPVTLLVLAWALSVLLSRGKWSGWGAMLASLALGGLAVGALKPTNTWDWPTYMVIALVATVYTFYRYSDVSGWRAPFGLPAFVLKLAYAFGVAAVLVGFSFLFYQPFNHWYMQGYGSLYLWPGSKTPFSSYFTQWGLFLFVIISWMVWETREWMAGTYMSQLKPLKPYAVLLELIPLGLLGVLCLMSITFGIKVSWVALPVALWAAILLFRPGIGDAKRAVLFLVGSALFITVVVEIVALVGDLGRMNTVFKFYLQAWTMFAISAAAALAWLVPEFPKWKPGWSLTWEVVFTLLLASAAIFLLVGGADKLRDRMNPEAPHSIDSMDYMNYAIYNDQGMQMDLSQDYRAIRWMQENVQGSPVIVEGNTVEYRWGSRFTIYTGLPGVVGWNWHERQQRALTPGTWPSDRVAEINGFYTTTDLEQAKSFLEKYNVKYIIVGQLERAYYPGEGLLKFPANDGTLWSKVYDDADTQIYEVIP